jgi:hypothetical protein
MTQIPVEALQEMYPDRHFRYVFAPEKGEDHGSFAKRRLQGYEPVSRAQLPDLEGIFGHGVGGDHIRMGDTILMSCPKELYQEEAAFRHESALEEANRPIDTFRRSVQSEESKGVAAEPWGDVKTHVEEYRLATPADLRKE